MVFLLCGHRPSLHAEGFNRSGKGLNSPEIAYTPAIHHNATNSKGKFEEIKI
jgi:hypothetical protein